MYCDRVIARQESVPPGFLRLAGHPLRWRLLSELARSDRQVRELEVLTGERQNLVSYHLGRLRAGHCRTASIVPRIRIKQLRCHIPDTRKSDRWKFASSTRNQLETKPFQGRLRPNRGPSNKNGAKSTILRAVSVFKS